MQLIIKEIDNRANFEPFSDLHLICELRCGMLRLFEKIEHYFNDCDIIYHCDSDVLLDSFIKRENKNNKIKENIPTLILYSNVLLDNISYNEIIKIIETTTNNITILDKNQKTIGYYFNNFDISKLDDKNENKIIINRTCVLNYIWDIFNITGEQINNDFNICIKEKQLFNNEINNIFISQSAKIDKSVIFDASLGNIIIDDNVIIMPFSFIQGPCYIGKNTIVKAGTKIYENCSFGPYCKIGGEIENTIFQGYSNKQHDGFIGHSFISEWINIGAGTSCSDLKNNYSNITIQLKNKKIETGKRFIGTIIGDHSKIAINTSLNTGTVIGIFSNIAFAGLTHKYISPFSWLCNNKIEKYELPKAIITARVVMNRRNKELSFEEQQLITNCFIKENR